MGAPPELSSAAKTDEPSPRLFLPGPTHVRPPVRAAMARPMIGHRGEAMRALLAEVLPGVAEAFGTTTQPVVLSCSSTGAMEAIARGVVRPGRRALHLVNGHFSALWERLSSACGRDTSTASRPWGDGWDEPAAAAALDEQLAAGPPPDAVFVTHCETSTGALSDVAGVARAARRAAPDALVCADVTSSAAGVALDVDAAGIDVAVGGVQKCWALPPALALVALSPRARRRLTEVPWRGRAHDPLVSLETQERTGMTLSTPAIPVLFALRRQLADIRASGGWPARFQRHLDMQGLVLEWAARHGLPVLARDGFRSPSVTSLACDGRFAIRDLMAGCASAGYTVAPGYGPTKTTHWRIGHMGDHDPACVAELLRTTDAILARLPPATA